MINIDFKIIQDYVNIKHKLQKKYEESNRDRIKKREMLKEQYKPLFLEEMGRNSRFLNEESCLI